MKKNIIAIENKLINDILNCKTELSIHGRERFQVTHLRSKHPEGFKLGKGKGGWLGYLGYPYHSGHLVNKDEFLKWVANNRIKKVL